MYDIALGGITVSEAAGSDQPIVRLPTATTGFVTFVSWSGLDIGLDRGSPVADYAAPFAFTGVLNKVTVVLDDDQSLDGEAVGAAEMARQ